MVFDSNIPPEMFKEILSYLPVKSLLRFRSVSKAWNSTIYNSNFMALHLNHYPNNHQEPHLMLIKLAVHCRPDTLEHRAQWFRRHCPATDQSYQRTSEFDFPVPIDSDPYDRGLSIHGYVDGVFLVRRLGLRRSPLEGDVVLWNPSIRRRLNIPLPPSFNLTMTDLFFGYDPLSKDYKVACFCYQLDFESLKVDIFSLKSRSWKRGRKIVKPDDKFHTASNKVLFGGSVYWVGYSRNENDRAFVRFDLMSETRSYMALTMVSYNSIVRPALVDGPAVGLLAYCDEVCDIWVLEKECWNKRHKLMNITYPGYDLYFRTVYFFNDNFVIWLYSNYRGDRSLCAYDIETKRKNIVLEDCPWPLHIAAYTESLVLLM